MGSPQPIADDHAAAGLAVVVLAQQSSELGRGSEDAEKVPGDVSDPELKRIAVPGKDRRQSEVRRHPGKRAGPFSPVLKIGAGKVVESRPHLWVGLVHADEPVRFGVRKRSEQHAVDDGKHGRIGADSERQRQQSHRREARCPSQGAQCVSHIPKQRVGPSERPHVTTALFGLFDTAKRQPRAPLRFGSAHATLRVGSRLHCDMKRQLVV